MNGEIVTFNGGDREYEGYLSIPTGGSGPGVIVIQEWWGLVDHIKDVCDRFAGEGFVALAPDLYFGERTTEPTRAGEKMMALNISETEEVLSKGIYKLLSLPQVTSAKAGVVGFCMGGQLAMFAACHNARIGACVNFYGVHPNVQPSFRQLEAPLLGIFGENDHTTPPEVTKALEAELSLLGKEHCFVTYPGVDHAFFNDTRPEVYNADAAKDAWARTLEFLREYLS